MLNPVNTATDHQPTPSVLTGTVQYYLSEAGRRASLRAGGDGRYEQQVSVTIEPKDLTLFTIDMDGRITARLDAGYRSSIPPPLDTLLSPEQAVMMLRQRAAQAEEETRKRRIEEEAREARKREECTRREQQIIEDIAALMQVDPTSPQACGKEVFTISHGQIVLHRSLIPRSCESQEAYAWITKRDAAAKARQQARIDALQAWAAAHGSDLLNARLAGGFEWIDLAEDEYIVAHSPQGFTQADDNSELCLCPTMEEMQALTALESTIQPPLSNPRLMQYSGEEEEIEDGEDTSPVIVALEVDISTPNGVTATVAKRLTIQQPS